MYVEDFKVRIQGLGAFIQEFNEKAREFYKISDSRAMEILMEYMRDGYSPSCIPLPKGWSNSGKEYDFYFAWRNGNCKESYYFGEYAGCSCKE